MAILDDRPVSRVEVNPRPGVDTAAWPYTIPAVRQLREEGLDLAPATVLVGPNGSGKSTIVEAIAMAFGLSGEGGSVHARHATRPSESPLWQDLVLARRGGSRWGYFLRAESMHGLFTYLERDAGGAGELHARSHGESFIDVVLSRFDSPGLYLLDEPESALSFDSSLALLAHLLDLLRPGGRQVIMATHSPVLAALPGAEILELGAEGFHRTSWEDLPMVDHYRRFLAGPERYLRHLA